MDDDKLIKVIKNGYNELTSGVTPEEYERAMYYVRSKNTFDKEIVHIARQEIYKRILPGKSTKSIFPTEYGYFGWEGINYYWCATILIVYNKGYVKMPIDYERTHHIRYLSCLLLKGESYIWNSRKRAQSGLCTFYFALKMIVWKRRVSERIYRPNGVGFTKCQQHFNEKKKLT